jgi:hypothetical protein
MEIGMGELGWVGGTPVPLNRKLLPKRLTEVEGSGLRSNEYTTPYLLLIVKTVEKGLTLRE